MKDKLLNRSVRVGDCLEYQGYKTPTGYRQVSVGGKMRQAHRVSFEVFNGPLTDGQVVRHTCDNRSCIEPTHLVAGTQSDNMDDMWSRNKSNRGNAKINEAIAEAIRNDPRKNVDIAAQYGITGSMVGQIKSGKAWCRR